MALLFDTICCLQCHFERAHSERRGGAQSERRGCEGVLSERRGGEGGAPSERRGGAPRERRGCEGGAPSERRRRAERAERLRIAIFLFAPAKAARRASGEAANSERRGCEGAPRSCHPSSWSLSALQRTVSSGTFYQGSGLFASTQWCKCTRSTCSFRSCSIFFKILHTRPSGRGTSLETTIATRSTTQIGTCSTSFGLGSVHMAR